MAVIGLAQLMVILDLTIVNVALPSAQHALGFTASDRQWIVTAYALAFGGLLLVGGRLTDMFGPKRTFLIGLVGFAVASGVGGASQSYAMLVAARAVQGCFAALLVPAALSLLTTTFTNPDERNKAFGIYTGIAGGGGAIGLALGGLLTTTLSWRWCMYVNVALAIPAFIGGIILIRHRARAHGATLDIPGSIFAVLGLGAIVYGFGEASVHGWGSGHTYIPIAAGLILLAAFVEIESRVAQPLAPLKIFRDRTRGASYIAITIAGIGSIGMFLIMSYYLQGVLRYTPLKTGLLFLPFTLSVITAANIVSTKLLHRVSPKLMVPAGLLIATGGAAWLTGVGTHTSYGGGVLPGLILLGLGIGTTIVSALTLGIAGADPADIGVASALVNASNQIGGSLGDALLNTLAVNAAASYLLARHGVKTAVPAASAHGDVVALTVMACILAGGAIVTGLLHRPGVPAIPDQAPAAA
jgi:EmrB/QacA subfamily drug resistance transporter